MLTGVTSQISCFCSRMGSLFCVLCSQTGFGRLWHLRTSCSRQFLATAASTPAGSGLPDHQAIVRPFVQHSILASQPDAPHSSSDILLIAVLWLLPVTCYASSCLLHASAPKFQPFSKHLKKGFLWVVPTSRLPWIPPFWLIASAPC